MIIFRSGFSIKVTGAKSYEKNDNFTYFNYMWLQVIYKVKVTDQGKCHIKVKVKISASFQFNVIYFVQVFSLKGSNGTNKVKGMSRLNEGQGEMKLKINSWQSC